MVVGIDACGVAVSKGDLDGVIAYLRGGLCAWLGLEHGQHGRGGHSRRKRLEGFFLTALVIAGRAGALIPQISKFIVARMAIGPGDVDTGAPAYVNRDAGPLCPWIEIGRAHV